ncbi:hypothetical protein ACFFHJ_18080 [Planotetraspora thailandica]|nr:hypothetical protein [Planotetraspora thailandica]
MPFKSVAETAEAYERVREAGERTGRAEAGRAPLHAPSALPPEDPVIGSPAKLVERIHEFAAIGASRVHLRLIDMNDPDHLELMAAEVLPYV